MIISQGVPWFYVTIRSRPAEVKQVRKVICRSHRQKALAPPHDFSFPTMAPHPSEQQHYPTTGAAPLNNQPAEQPLRMGNVSRLRDDLLAALGFHKLDKIARR